MFLSRIELAPGGAARPAFWSRIQEGYGVHELVWNWFGDSPDRVRDFLFRQEGSGVETRFYTLSERPPVDRDGLWTILTKGFAPTLRAGDRLGFSLRANPTRCAANGPAKGARHDVVIDAKKRVRECAAVGAEGPDLVQAACVEWLRARAAARGFDVAAGEVRADGYRQHRLHRRGKPPIRFSTVEFEGLLTVIDPERFVAALREGVGPEKGFGCGLMLVRRAPCSRP